MPIKRPPTSEEQKEKLRQAQLRYIQTDPRWEQHRTKLAEAQKKPEQRERQSLGQRNYMENDPRWPSHETRFRQAALDVNGITLYPEEIETVVAMRKKGRNFEYIAEQLCVGERVIRRELKALGISTAPVKPDKRAKRGTGYWRSFDEV